MDEVVKTANGVAGPDGASRLWTHDETAEYLHVSPWTLHHLVSEGRGPAAYKVGRHRRYDPDEVRAWLRTQPAYVR